GERAERLGELVGTGVRDRGERSSQRRRGGCRPRQRSGRKRRGGERAERGRTDGTGDEEHGHCQVPPPLHAHPEPPCGRSAVARSAPPIRGRASQAPSVFARSFDDSCPQQCPGSSANAVTYAIMIIRRVRSSALPFAYRSTPLAPPEAISIDRIQTASTRPAHLPCQLRYRHESAALMSSLRLD